MYFTSKRGRPRTLQSTGRKKDYGTRELQAKRKQYVTSEPLDYCLGQGWITAEEHWCGNHLRYLHAVRYGVIRPRAVMWAEDDSPSHAPNDAWLARKYQRYRDALDVLYNHGAARVVMQIAIYHETPIWFLEHVQAMQRAAFVGYGSENRGDQHHDTSSGTHRATHQNVQQGATHDTRKGTYDPVLSHEWKQFRIGLEQLTICWHAQGAVAPTCETK